MTDDDRYQPEQEYFNPNVRTYPLNANHQRLSSDMLMHQGILTAMSTASSSKQGVAFGPGSEFILASQVCKCISRIIGVAPCV
jgi:hypothetical protein